MSKILVISADTIPIQNHLAAGTGIRAWEIAKGLAKYGHDITIAVPKKCYNSDLEEYLGIEIKTWDYENVISLCDDTEAVFIPQGDAFFSNFFAEHIRKDLCVIVDVYDPNLIEAINLFPPNPGGIKGFSDYLMGIVPVLKRGDLFICASDRQRYYYLGVLNVLGRINPLTYDQRLIEIVPFGVPDDDPVYEVQNNVMRGGLVNPEDLVVLWFGGIYPWFDTVTLIKAIDIAVKKNPNIKLVIMGAVHPRLHAPPDNYIKTLELSKELGLYNKNIFFTDWRPYDERIYWYREADIGICTFPMHLETELSNRTRVVDMLWGGLPVVTTEGDELSTLIKQYNCGELVKPNNPEQLSQVLLDILKDKERRKTMVENTKRFADSFRWKKVVRPLAEFLNKPELSKDRMDEFTSNSLYLYMDTYKKHIALFEHEIKTRDEQIRTKDEQIRTKDEQILTRDEQLLIKDQQIAVLNESIKFLEVKLTSIQCSISWKITSPFRYLHNLLIEGNILRR